MYRRGWEGPWTQRLFNTDPWAVLEASLPRDKSHIPNPPYRGSSEHLPEGAQGRKRSIRTIRKTPTIPPLGVSKKTLIPQLLPVILQPLCLKKSSETHSPGAAVWVAHNLRGINQLCFGQTWLKTPVLQSAGHWQLKLISWWKSAPHAHSSCNSWNLHPARLCWMHPGFLYGVKNKTYYLLRFGMGCGDMTARSWNV